jgi:lipopolysaccharide export system protein LptA
MTVQPIRFAIFLLGLFAVAQISPIQIDSAGAFSNGRDSDKPIDVSADHSEVLQEGRALFTGHVVLIQGETTLKCDRLTMFFHSNNDGTKNKPKPQTDPGSEQKGFYRYEADGAVFITSLDETASGDHAVFEVEKKLITMTGPVILTRGQNVLRGTKLLIQTETGKSQLDPDKDGRVKGVFVPEKKDDGKAKPPGGK